VQCLYPQSVTFLADGKTITWSKKHYSPEYAPFKVPCGKCIQCRLNYARQWAIRCMHEAKMHENNCFITLTYDDAHLGDGRLNYKHFQEFMYRLRTKIFKNFISQTVGLEYWNTLSKSEKATFRKEHKTQLQKNQIGYFVTGEYGEKTKRPHWHAIIFNWQPNDLEFKYTSENNDKVYTSQTLKTLWPDGNSELGSVNFNSAGYVARYAAKKLVHGDDGHEYEPISKKSTKQAIGKKFLEKYYKDIFNHGICLLENGQYSPIPRYYEKWLLKNHPDEYVRYVTEIKPNKSQLAQKKVEEELSKMCEQNYQRHLQKGKDSPLITKQEVQIKIIEERFKRLQSYLKGDL